MQLRGLIILISGVFILLLSQCTSVQPTTSVPAPTSLPSTSPPEPTIEVGEPTFVVPTDTTEPPTLTAPPSTPTSTTSPASSTFLDGATLVQERCTTCHGIDRIQSVTKTRDEWEKTVKRMISKGANLSSDEKDIVIEYLAETFKK